jgi:hypothetical protein
VLNKEPGVSRALTSTKIQAIDVYVPNDYDVGKHGEFFDTLNKIAPVATAVSLKIWPAPAHRVASTLRPPPRLKHLSLMNGDVINLAYRGPTSSNPMPFENLRNLEGLLCAPFCLLWLFSQSEVVVPNLRTLVLRLMPDARAHVDAGCFGNFWTNLLSFAPNFRNLEVHCTSAEGIREISEVSHKSIFP